MIQYILIVLSVMLVAGTKFILAPALACLTYKLSYIESVLYTIVGAVLGIFLYAYLFNALMQLWQKIKKWIRRGKTKQNPKKISRKRLRKLIYLKNKWGLWGVAALIPILSLPVSTFLAIRFFPRSRPLFVLTCAIVLWSVLFNTVYFLIGKSIM